VGVVIPDPAEHRFSLHVVLLSCDISSRFIPMIIDIMNTSPQAMRLRPSKSHGNRSSKPGADAADAQVVLNVFAHTFMEVMSSDGFSALVQEVKQALFNRTFDEAFASKRYLEAYAARWSPTRALCYASLLTAISSYLTNIGAATTTTQEDSSQNAESFRMLAIGGGAAELVALGSFLHNLGGATAILTLIDAGPWGQVVDKLYHSLTSPPPLSKYASEAAKAANKAKVTPSQLSWTFIMQDVLNMTTDDLAKQFGAEPCLITILFTLNELYASGIGRTTSFLLSLTDNVPNNTLLLVVDSPGSYSDTVVGKESKKYPMNWLLDHTLLKTDRGPGENCKWEKLESHDSIWFRLSKSLQYPIPLEDMRYQMHLYRAIKPPS
jgi:25S rRNA (uracil2843-N3)-methyltransferase